IFNKKTIVAFLLLFGVIYSVIYNKYDKTKPYAIIKIYDPNEAILYRIFGLQGHLMWGAVETYVYKQEDHTYRFSDFNMGMHRLMEKFAFKKKGFEKAMEKGFNFTNAYPSILFMVYPVGIALIVHVILTIIFLGFSGWLLMQFILNESYVISVIMYQFFNWTIYAFTMGYFYKLKFMMIFLLCYVAFLVFKNEIKKKKQLKINF